jgi:hypothetical protein
MVSNQDTRPVLVCLYGAGVVVDLAAEEVLDAVWEEVAVWGWDV